MAALARPCLLRQSPVLSKPALQSLSRTAFRKPTSLPKPAFVKQSLPGSCRVAAFHSSSRKNILPPLPEKIQGTANDPVPIPPPHPTEGAYHWIAERAISVILIPVTIAPFVGNTTYPIFDATFCGLLVLHSHIGFQSVITDYIPRWRLPVTRRVFDWGLVAGSALVAYGLWEFETNDVGLCEGVKKVWKA